VTPTPDQFEPAAPLPGLENLAAENVPPLVRALHRTIAALDAGDLLEEAHALDLEAMRLLARSAGMKLATGRASTIANDVDLLLRIKQNIVTPPVAGEGNVDEELRRAMAEFERHLDEAGA
jgi:hypothetical protein